MRLGFGLALLLAGAVALLQAMLLPGALLIALGTAALLWEAWRMLGAVLRGRDAPDQPAGRAPPQEPAGRVPPQEPAGRAPPPGAGRREE